MRLAASLSAHGRVQKPPQSKRIRSPMRRLTRICLIAACGLIWAMASGGAEARPISLRDILSGMRGAETRPHPSAPPVARYTPDAGRPFVLDRSTPVTLLRFEDSPEIWVLQPQPGPRGDIIYRNDLGEPMLRYTRLGGLTVFTIDHPDGEAAAFAGEAGALHALPILTPSALLQRLAQASAHASHAAQRLVEFDAPDVTPATATVFADTAIVAADAIGNVSHKSEAHKFLSKLAKVLLVPGHKVGAVFNEGVLQVTIDGRQGLAGRPSSRRIIMALMGSAP